MVAVWIAAAGVFGALALLRRRDGAMFAVAFGFANLALATGMRALGGPSPPLLWMLYLLAAVGLMTSIELAGRRAAAPEEARER